MIWTGVACKQTSFSTHFHITKDPLGAVSSSFFSEIAETLMARMLNKRRRSWRPPHVSTADISMLQEVEGDGDGGRL